MYVDVQYICKNYKRTFLSTSKIDSAEEIDGKKMEEWKMLGSIIQLSWNTVIKLCLQIKID